VGHEGKKKKKKKRRDSSLDVFLPSGQTGSGKTFTMLDPKHGLYIMAAKDIFTMLRRPENQHLSAWIGLYEIYQGQLYDLLNNRKKLFAREDGKQNVIISGLKEYPIDNVDKLIQVFDYGSQVRSTGKRNEESGGGVPPRN
jgi:hypothetical protein